jgi:hypothetical protein
MIEIERDFVTFREAAGILGVGVPTISKWTQQKKLQEGPPIGKKIKTVFKTSLEALQSDPTFKLGLEINRRGKIKRYDQQDEKHLSPSEIGNIEKQLETFLNNSNYILTLQNQYRELAARVINIEKQLETFLNNSNTAKKNISLVKNETTSIALEQIIMGFKVIGKTVKGIKQYQAYKRIDGKQCYVYLCPETKPISTALAEEKIKTYLEKQP